MKKRKAFTLIELIATLVILSIVLLIVSLLVLNIIRKFKIATNKRSVDNYGKSIELAISNFLLQNGSFPTNLYDLPVEYTGSKVECNIMLTKVNGGLYMSHCLVNGKEVKDDSTEDGYYHYGTKDMTAFDFVDRYGKSIEKSLKEYHDINNSYPNDISILQIDFSQKNVSCDSSINYNGTVYLTNCIVDGVSVTDPNSLDGYYHYREYLPYRPSKIGDLVTYNNIDFTVIKDSNENSDTLTLLKAKALSTAEVNEYGGYGTENNHANRYADCNGAEDSYGYGKVAFYTSSTCTSQGSGVFYGCTNDYAQSDIKYIVDAWGTSNLNQNDLKIDNTGYSVRLITYDELRDNLGYDKAEWNGSYWEIDKEFIPKFVYNSHYPYWTMTPYETDSVIWVYNNEGLLDAAAVYSIGPGRSRGRGAVRPVINLSKYADIIYW